MNNTYEIEYITTLKGGKATVIAETHDEAIRMFYGKDGCKQIREPTPETTVKNILKLKAK